MTSDAISLLLRWVLPIALGTGIAGLARRTGSLSRSGAVAAAFVGTMALWAGWSWGAHLIVWFAIASLASRLGAARKQQHTAGVVAKGGTRDAWQVLANGGVFALLAAWHTALHLWPDVWPSHDTLLTLSTLGAAAALASAGADTLATEVGTWIGGTPWSIRTGQRVPPGTSGAVSLAGTIALISAAILFAWIAVLTQLVYDPSTGGATSAHVVIVAIAAIGGAFVDTFIGAWYQQERWCTTCGESTEQIVHVCGTQTVVHRGLSWLTNDGVNVACTCVGAALAMALAWRWGMI
ncbi:MAG: DUF92 domain-containing protein [Gemmatimonadaceae bacterium]|nr:DUF92 domain-containing protein [Gemmatimonadaceae bacterium]